MTDTEWSGEGPGVSMVCRSVFGEGFDVCFVRQVIGKRFEFDGVCMLEGAATDASIQQ